MIYLTLIKSFLTSKIGQYILIAILISSVCFFGYKHIYSKGYTQATNDFKVEEQKAINKALEEQKSRLLIEKEDAIKVATDMQKIKTVYVDRVKTVTKIISNSSVLSNPACVMEEQEVKDINKLLVTP
mgnify:CR=1 FL=1